MDWPDAYFLAWTTAAPLTLTTEQRAAIEAQLMETCRDKRWRLLALRVAAQEIQLVVAAEDNSRMVMTELKGWATVRLRSEGLLARDVKPWAKNGVVRELRTEDELDAARRTVDEAGAAGGSD